VTIIKEGMQMAYKKILMITGDYAEDYEVMVPFQAMIMVGHTVHATCPGKKPGDWIRTAVHDFEGDQNFSEKRGHNFVLNTDFDTIDVSGYDALLIPGGRAPEYIRLNERVKEIVRQFMSANKPVAAICHGPQLLISAGVLKGRKCSACGYIQPDIIAAGGEYIDIPEADAFTDGNLVTAPGWSAIPSWLSQFLFVLGTRITL
jgi:protease I